MYIDEIDVLLVRDDEQGHAIVRALDNMAREYEAKAAADLEQAA